MSSKALDHMVKELEANNISVRQSRLHRGQSAQALGVLDEQTPPVADSQDKTIVQIKPETIDAIMSLPNLPSQEQATFPLERQLVKATQWTESTPSPDIMTWQMIKTHCI